MGAAGAGAAVGAIRCGCVMMGLMSDMFTICRCGGAGAWGTGAWAGADAGTGTGTGCCAGWCCAGG